MKISLYKRILKKMHFFPQHDSAFQRQAPICIQLCNNALVARKNWF